MVPIDYQIRFSKPMEIVLSFMMHKDSMGTALTDSMLCGEKMYSSGASWLTV